MEKLVMVLLVLLVAFVGVGLFLDKEYDSTHKKTFGVFGLSTYVENSEVMYKEFENELKSRGFNTVVAIKNVHILSRVGKNPKYNESMPSTDYKTFIILDRSSKIKNSEVHLELIARIERSIGGSAFLVH